MHLGLEYIESAKQNLDVTHKLPSTSIIIPSTKLTWFIAGLRAKGHYSIFALLLHIEHELKELDISSSSIVMSALDSCSHLNPDSPNWPQTLQVDLHFGEHHSEPPEQQAKRRMTQTQAISSV